MHDFCGLYKKILLSFYSLPIAKGKKLCYNKGAKEKEVQSNEKLSLDVEAGCSEKKIKRFG